MLVFTGRRSRPQRRPGRSARIETYLACPFKFFAQHVLSARREPDDEEVMDSRSRVLRSQSLRSFLRGGATAAVEPSRPTISRKHGQCSSKSWKSTLEPCRNLAALERTRLLGSSAAAGLGEAVLRMEAERPIGVVDRSLEYPPRRFHVPDGGGPRTFELKGKADRVDLLADERFG